VTILVFLVAASLAVAVIGFWALRSRHEEDIWAIGIYGGTDPLRIAPLPATNNLPVLTAQDVSDANAQFVADPFLARHDGRWLLFFEVLNGDSGRGELAYATSENGVHWQYRKVILKESFHLSYPQVFEFEGAWYMIPETGESRSVRLYRAARFPEGWTCVAELLQGNYLDPTLLRHEGRWWLFSLRDGKHLSLHFADRLEGPWTEHPSSPVSEDARLVRPGGRILVDGDRILRFSQDGTATYGHRAFVSVITELTPSSYREHLVTDNPLICASGRGWNADGMHHIDLQPAADGSWLAAVDGKFIRRQFYWRKGVRAILDLLTGASRTPH